MKKLTPAMEKVLADLEVAEMSGIYGLPASNYRKTTVAALVERGLVFFYSTGSSRLNLRRVPEKKDGTGTAAG